MRLFDTNKGTYGIPDSWADCTPEDFLLFCQLYLKLESGEIDIKRFKMLALAGITGYRPHWWPPKKAKQEENLFLLSEGFDFMLAPNPDGGMGINIDFGRNLLPFFEVESVIFTGPKFTVGQSGGQLLLDTDLNAIQFIEGLEAYNLYVQNGTPDDLVRLAKSLYVCAFVDAETQLKKAPGHVLFGVFLVFRFMLEFLTRKTMFAQLWGGNGSGKISLGMTESLFSLVTDGYGTQDEVGKMEITAFFAALLKARYDLVRQMKHMKMSIKEMVEASGLPSEIIVKL